MKSWTCTICNNPVAEFAAHVKLSSTKYAHLMCYQDQLVEKIRQQVLEKQAEDKMAEEQRRAEQAQREARETFDRLARCHRCGVKCTTEPGLVERLRPHGEVRVLSSSTPGVCAQCVREEARARQTAVNITPASAAQAIQQAPSAPPPKAEQEKTDGPKKDRAALLEIE